MFYHPVDISGGEEDLAENLDEDEIENCIWSGLKQQ